MTRVLRRALVRTGNMLVILFLSSVAVFFTIRMAGGDVTGVALPSSATPEQRQAFRESLGLFDPIHVQYVDYFGSVLRGDLGRSLVHGAQIQDMLINHGWNSLLLGAAAFAIIFGVGVPLGVLAAWRRNRLLDQAISAGSVLGMAIPNFWLALLTIWLFAWTLGWLPAAGCCSFQQLILPASVLAAEGTALTVRMTRSAMLDNLNQDFVRTLRAGGLAERVVVGKHVLRNAIIPIISLAGLRIGQIVGYALIVEVIFGWPGLGQVLVDAVLRRDFPVVQFFSLVLVAIVVIGNWLGEVGYSVADPKLRRAAA